MLFLKDPDNYLLLELELLTDAESALKRLKRHFDFETGAFDAILFGKTLFFDWTYLDDDVLILDKQDYLKFSNTLKALSFVF